MKFPIEHEIRFWSEGRRKDFSLAQRDIAIAAHVNQLSRARSETGVKRSDVRPAVNKKVVFDRPKYVRPFDHTSYDTVVVRAHLLGSNNGIGNC